MNFSKRAGPLSLRFCILMGFVACATPKADPAPAAAGASGAPAAPTSTEGAAALPAPLPIAVLPAAPAPVPAAEAAAGISKLCGEIEKLYRRNMWGQSICRSVPFKVIGWSVKRRPIVQFEAGDANSQKRTVIQCGIHGDELPSIAMCFRMIFEVMEKKKTLPAHVQLIVQPLLNPDGMLAGRPQRPNINGVDINRNFPTQDWPANALESWQRKDKGDPRKFPGRTANSEPETDTVVNFVNQVRPQKILSIHTPLGFLDLDSKGGPDIERRAKFLAVNMSKNSGNYTFKSFGYYPGSLGNYAGRERQIPTYTLELPAGKISRPTIDHYWKRFRVALWRAVEFDLDTGDFIERPEED